MVVWPRGILVALVAGALGAIGVTLSRRLDQRTFLRLAAGAGLRLLPSHSRSAYAAHLLNRYLSSHEEDLRLRYLQQLLQYSEELEESDLDTVVQQVAVSDDRRQMGELCYSLGQRGIGHGSILLKWCSQSGDPWLEKQAQAALRIANVEE
jgi:hypothetical protein